MTQPPVVAHSLEKGAPTLSSSQTAPQRSPMQGSLRARPSAICTAQCCRQHASQKACPHSIAVHACASTSQKQQPHVISLLPAPPAHASAQSEVGSHDRCAVQAHATACDERCGSAQVSRSGRTGNAAPTGTSL